MGNFRLKSPRFDGYHDPYIFCDSLASMVYYHTTLTVIGYLTSVKSIC